MTCKQRFCSHSAPGSCSPKRSARYCSDRVFEDHRRRTGFALAARFIVDGMRIEVVNRAQETRREGRAEVRDEPIALSGIGVSKRPQFTYGDADEQIQRKRRGGIDGRLRRAYAKP